MIAIIYLGKRGGGLALFESILTEIDSVSSIVPICAKDSNSVAKDRFPNSATLTVPHTFKDLFFLYRYLFETTRLLFTLKKLKVVSAVFLMPHPLDLYLAYLFRTFSINVTYVIHDHQNHPGEIWPRKRSISTRVRLANNLIFFSNFVKTHFDKHLDNKGVYVSKLEARRPYCSQKNFRNEIEFEPYFIVTGRMKQYKGVKDFIEVWTRLAFCDVKLLIAGEGSSEFAKELTNVENVIFLDKWLSDLELWSLIDNSTGVILPYREASQSGIVAIAVNLGVPILATRVGALPEQLMNVKNCVLVDPDLGDLCESLKKLSEFERESSHDVTKMDISIFIENFPFPAHARL